MAPSKVNPWTLERLEEAARRASPLRFIVEVAPGAREKVKAELSRLPGVSVVGQPADVFLVVEAPPEALPRIEAVREVVKVSSETLVWIRWASFPLPPLATVASDPWLGEVRVSPVEVEVRLLPPGLAGEVVVTTKRVRELLGLPPGARVRSRVAVLDTGLTPAPPFFDPARVHLESLTGEPPLDGHSHGQHCTATAFGMSAVHPVHGECAGMVEAEQLAHYKVLSNAGFGMTSWVLEGMYRAVRRYGARVVSMSLGGPLQGSAIDDDPLCRLLSSLSGEAVFCVAAGNEGPSEWTIGSPGASPDCVAVGSMSLTDGGPAWWSSRGPSGEFYRDHPDAWERDLARRGEDMVKPDCVCLGGGRAERGARPDEMILSAGTPWYGPLTDPAPGFSLMHGTSQATPAAAGVVALAYELGLVRSAADVKERLRRTWRGEKSVHVGYGLITFNRLRGAD